MCGTIIGKIIHSISAVNLVSSPSSPEGQNVSVIIQITCDVLSLKISEKHHGY